MSVGEASFPFMSPVKGIKLAVAAAGIKAPERNDVVLIEVCEGASIAGVFTQNAFCAAPVTICREHLAQASARFLLINSGNANACTGAQGKIDALMLCESIAKQTGVNANQVLPFSTGVIGEPLPVNKIDNALPSALTSLNDAQWEFAARAIMTTDTCPKGFSQQLQLFGKTVTVNGISKGAGMINPNMATMLGFIATDANVDPVILQALTKEAADLSFNRITIDGDTSTNDACMLIATGASATPIINSANSTEYKALQSVVFEAFTHLAQAIVADGEGATKFVTINITSGKNQDECLDVAYSIAHSPLVKTALFASDPNWGRIVAAIGYADVPNLDASKVRVCLNDVLIVERGGCAKTYTEAQGQAVMDGEKITIHVDLGRGNCSETLWTTDLSYEYVRINADYRS